MTMTCLTTLPFKDDNVNILLVILHGAVLLCRTVRNSGIAWYNHIQLAIIYLHPNREWNNIHQDNMRRLIRLLNGATTQDTGLYCRTNSHRLIRVNTATQLIRCKLLCQQRMQTWNT